MKIIFIGTPEFGTIILEKLIKSGNKPFLVITAPDKPVGRKQLLTPPPVKIMAENYNIPVVQPDRIKNYAEEIKKMEPDLIILAAYGQIIPKEILDIPAYGCLNVHPSVLPKYRGASPIQYAILNGDEKTGVTIMRMVEKLDAGPIILQKEINISPKEAFKILHDKLAEIGAEMLIHILPKLSTGEVAFQPQDDTQATFTKILTKEDGKIDWHKPAVEIERQIRALAEWPGAYTSFKGKALKILEADMLNLSAEGEAGRVFLTRDREVAVKAGQNCLNLQKLQIEGGKPMSAKEFILGHADFIGTILR